MVYYNSNIQDKIIFLPTIFFQHALASGKNMCMYRYIVFIYVVCMLCGHCASIEDQNAMASVFQLDHSSGLTYAQIIMPRGLQVQLLAGVGTVLTNRSAAAQVISNNSCPQAKMVAWFECNFGEEALHKRATTLVFSFITNKGEGMIEGGPVGGSF